MAKNINALFIYGFLNVFINVGSEAPFWQQTLSWISDGSLTRPFESITFSISKP